MKQTIEMFPMGGEILLEVSKLIAADFQLEDFDRAIDRFVQLDGLAPRTDRGLFTLRGEKGSIQVHLEFQEAYLYAVLTGIPSVHDRALEYLNGIQLRGEPREGWRSESLAAAMDEEAVQQLAVLMQTEYQGGTFAHARGLFCALKNADFLLRSFSLSTFSWRQGKWGETPGVSVTLCYRSRDSSCICHVSGKGERCERALEYLKEREVLYEV